MQEVANSLQLLHLQYRNSVYAGAKLSRRPLQAKVDVMGVRRPKAEPFWLNAKLFEQVVLPQRLLYACLRLVELQGRLSLSLHQTPFSLFFPRVRLALWFEFLPIHSCSLCPLPLGHFPQVILCSSNFVWSVLCRRPDRHRENPLKVTRKDSSPQSHSN